MAKNPNLKLTKVLISLHRNIYKKWQQGKYRQQQMHKWSHQIKNIVPHWPNMEHLAVVGTKISEPQEPDQKEPEKAASVEDRLKIQSSSSGLFHQYKLSLDINGIPMEFCEHEGIKKFRLFFEYDICSSDIMVDFLNFENRGTATLRISWKKLEKFRLFRNFTNEPWEQHGFYFSRQELVLLPGTRVNLPFWFKTRNAGNYSESWELVTAPRMWSEDYQVILVLESYAYFKNLQKEVDLIVKYIDMEAKNIVMKDILDELLESVKYTETPTVTCYYGEPHLFEIANLVNGRPLFLFNEKMVEELKLIYDSVKIDDCTCGWNYSIKQLQMLTHEKDVTMYGEKILSAILDKLLRIEKELKEKPAGATKQSKEDKKGSKSSKSSKSKKGKKAKKSESSEKEPEITETKELRPEQPYEYSNQLQLQNTLRKFDSPVIINTDREKFAACFHVLGAYFNKMCHELSDLEIRKNIAKTSFYPVAKNKLVHLSAYPERKVYEYFEHNYVPAHEYDDYYPFETNKKPKKLRDIPSEDVEATYVAYFNKPLRKKVDKEDKTKKKGDKGKKKKKDDKKSKSSKKSSTPSGKKGKQSKEKLVRKEVSIVSFNPYGEDFQYVAENEPEEEFKPGEDVVLLKAEEEDYQYNQYLIVYSCLGHAVDALVDTLESFECVVPYPTIDVIQSQFPHDGPEPVKKPETESCGGEPPKIEDLVERKEVK